MSKNCSDILIVDDDSGILALLSEAFTELGLGVQTAQSIAEARDKARRNPFRVILCDQNLGDGLGIDLFSELCGTAVESVPILMTGFVDLEVAMEAINRGQVYKFVTKPLDLAMLQDVVCRAIEHHDRMAERRRFTERVVGDNSRLRQEADSRERQLAEVAEQVQREVKRAERHEQKIDVLTLKVQAAYLEAVKSLSAAIEARDPYTQGHSRRVHYYSLLIAGVLGLSEESRCDLKSASILHDLGKIALPDSILMKRGDLTDDERRAIMSHPVLSETILRPCTFLSRVRKIIRQHHERYDGGGYPDGLAKEQILLESRILAVADTYDAMRSDRAYRPALSIAEAMDRLRAGSGRQFCPLCVGAFFYAVGIHGEYSGPEETSLQEILGCRVEEDASDPKGHRVANSLYC